MTNESTNRLAADNILKQTARSSRLLKFSSQKVKFSVGKDEDVPLGREYLADCRGWAAGWLKWKGGAIVDQRLGCIADGFVPAGRADLGDTDESAWQDGNDPWQHQNALPLEDLENGELLVFVGTSIGAGIAVKLLCSQWAREVKAGHDKGRPTIKLGIGEFPGKNGPVKRPDFEIVGWEHDRPLSAASTKHEPDDEIPF
jgi:hypothetical protein